MKKLNIYYWICTGMIILALGIGSVFGVMKDPDSIKVVTSLGYPEYLEQFLSVARLLGILAILVPGFPRIKEWAYAGLTFDLVGALYSQIAMGTPLTHWIGPFVPMLFLAGSYIFYHKRQQFAVK